MRIVGAGCAGLAIAVVSAIVLGDYPLSGSVPWLAAVLIPFLIGAAMVLIAGDYEVTLWVITGPVATVAMLWGIRIATGWGLDPVPSSAWISAGLALAWPPAWAATVARRTSSATGATGAAGAGRAAEADGPARPREPARLPGPAGGAERAAGPVSGTQAEPAAAADDDAGDPAKPG